MAAKGKRINDLTAITKIPANGCYPVGTPTGTKKVSQLTLTQDVYERLQYGTDADVAAIIAGTYEDPVTDDWGSEGGQEPSDPLPEDPTNPPTPPPTEPSTNPEDVATDTELNDYLGNLDLFGN